jgi:prefoldin subunit 5
MPNEPIAFDIMLIQSSIAEVHKRLDSMDVEVHTQNEVINDLGRAHAVFEYRHNEAKQISEKLEQLVDRISERGEDELRQTIEMIDKREERLAESIAAHKEIVLREVALQHQTLKQSIDSLQRAIDELVRSRTEDSKQFDAIKKWMWSLMGALAVLSFFADKIISAVVG